ncbi:MAG: hypothetical protein WDM91_04335 [Rhizomicrobium sp.]
MSHEIAEIRPEAVALRQAWTTPAMRVLNASQSELGVGATVDVEGHS